MRSNSRLLPRWNSHKGFDFLPLPGPVGRTPAKTRASLNLYKSSGQDHP
jgi:hypothetical protein